jgi:hypothetical protein
VVALIAILVFAPNALPALANLAGRLFQREVRRRLGVPEPPVKPARRNPPTIELIPPTARRPSTRHAADYDYDYEYDPTPNAQGVQPGHRSQGVGRPTPADIIDATPLPPRKRTVPYLLPTAAVITLIAVLSWILFHSR